jgi:hypothetical protein
MKRATRRTYVGLGMTVLVSLQLGFVSFKTYQTSYLGLDLDRRLETIEITLLLESDEKKVAAVGQPERAKGRHDGPHPLFGFSTPDDEARSLSMVDFTDASTSGTKRADPRFGEVAMHFKISKQPIRRLGAISITKDHSVTSGTILHKATKKAPDPERDTNNGHLPSAHQKQKMTNRTLFSKLPTMTIEDIIALQASTAPDKRLSTIAFERNLQLGFRESCISFSALVMEAVNKKIPQVLLPSLSFKDYQGSDKRINFELLFDVIHWNSHYPALPRLVAFNEEMHPNWNARHGRFLKADPARNDTSTSEKTSSSLVPFPGGEQEHMAYYSNYTGYLALNQMAERHPAELMILRGALRPHIEIRRHLSRLKQAGRESDGGNGAAGSNNKFMALHAFVEPGVERSRSCIWARVQSLATIFAAMEREFPTPPAHRLFVAVDRNRIAETSDNLDAVDNLKTLNSAVSKGLWNGTVQVFETGMESLRDTPFESRASVVGSMVDFFLAQDSILFIGTERSSFSMDVITSRFYQDSKENYLYLPRGITHATPSVDEFGSVTRQPPRFKCY